jgi:uncharacterized coiled-coil protein SlyX
MSNSATTEPPAHEPSALKDAKWTVHKVVENWLPIVFVSLSFGGLVFWGQKIRYKDKMDGLNNQIGTQNATIQEQSATIQNQSATIAQLREQLKGTSPELAAIQANRDTIRAGLKAFYIRGGEIFRRKVVDEPTMNNWVNDANSWYVETAKWINEHMGEAAVEKFIDMGNTADVGWGDSFSQIHTNMRNSVARYRRNLSTLIETAAWDGHPERQK